MLFVREVLTLTKLIFPKERRIEECVNFTGPFTASVPYVERCNLCFSLPLQLKYANFLSTE